MLRVVRTLESFAEMLWRLSDEKKRVLSVTVAIQFGRWLMRLPDVECASHAQRGRQMQALTMNLRRCVGEFLE